MLRVSLLSRWHVHADEYAGYALQNPNVEIVNVWDEDAERGKKWAQELGVPFVSTLEELFTDASIDGIVVATPTSMHKEIMIKAANAKKHIFTEKVLAFTEKDCLAIYEAVEKNDVKLLVSLPRLTEPYYLYVEDAIKNGVVGEVNLIRCKVAHDGALPSVHHELGWLPEYFYDENLSGGGALIDFGAHPIYISNRLGGKIKNISSMLSQFTNKGVDDNSVVLAQYESGALGVLEVSFVTKGCPFFLEIFGTKNSIIIEGDCVRVRNDQGEWISPQLPPRDLNPFTQWVESIIHDYQPTITKEDAIALTVVNELAYSANLCKD
ncbi:MAG: Gfo/Idh/MocA family protein [Turicibacter sp.]